MAVGVFPHVTRAPTAGFSHPDLLFFSRPGCLRLVMNVFNNIQLSLYYGVYMCASGDKVRISDEAERVQSISYPHIRSLSELCIRIMLFSLMPIEETAETRVRTDYLNFYVSQCRQIKTQISCRGRRHWDYILIGF